MTVLVPRRNGWHLLRLCALLGPLLCAVPPAAAQAPAPAQAAPLIPREILFGNPERTSPELSGDGKRLAWLAPDKKNVLQVWVKTIGQPADKPDDKMVTDDKKRGIRLFQWAPDSRSLLYLQDLDGDENWHVYGVDLTTGNVRDYTPFQGVRADILAVQPDVKDQILVQMNARKRELVAKDLKALRDAARIEYLGKYADAASAAATGAAAASPTFAPAAADEASAAHK